MNDHNLIFNADEKRFEMMVDNAKATLFIEEYSPSVWIFTHTLVPDPLKGKGIGSELLEKVLTYCQEHKIKVIPECSFVAAYFRRHPQWQSLLNSNE
jgi:predicted GNAT family acetyltransferase